MLHLNIAFKYRSTFTYWFKLGMLHVAKKTGNVAYGCRNGLVDLAPHIVNK
jgi:hypothetical protein